MDILDIDREDDNLLTAGTGPVNPELFLGVSPPSPSVISCKKPPQPSGDLENCSGELGEADKTVVIDMDAEIKIAPAISSSVLSVLDLNAINKFKTSPATVEDSWSLKALAAKDTGQLEGIAEASPVENATIFRSQQLSRSYLDIERQQESGTRENGGIEPAVARRSRTRRSTTLRKSLAWDKAFFTDEGVLDNEELFAVASDTPKALPMPELATIWDGRQSLVMPFEAITIPSNLKAPIESGLTTSSNLKAPIASMSTTAVVPKPQQDVIFSSLVRPVKEKLTNGSHAFSSAYSRAAAIPQGSTLIPLPSALPRSAKQASAHVADQAQGITSDVKEPRHTAPGLHHQARLAALRKAHEVPAQKGPRVKLPSSSSSKKVEEKILEKTQRGRQPMMMRSMSSPNVKSSPSALSRKVSSMSKKVKDTLGKVMTGRGLTASSAPPSPQLSNSAKTSVFTKKLRELQKVPEVKQLGGRATEKATKGVYTVRDMLRGKPPPSSLSSKDTMKHIPVLTRSKSALAAPALPRTSVHGLLKEIAPLPTEPVYAAKPTGLRKPSPKLGFFDSARTSSTPQPAVMLSQTLQGVQIARPGSESPTVTFPSSTLSQRLQGLSSSKGSSAIPSAPHLRYGFASAPNSPRGARVMYPNSPQGLSYKSTRPLAQVGDFYGLPQNRSNSFQAKQIAESHQLTARKLQLGDAECAPAHETKGADSSSFKLPESRVIASHSSESECDTESALKTGRKPQEKSLQDFVQNSHATEAPVNSEIDAIPVHCSLRLQSDTDEDTGMKIVVTLSLPDRTSDLLRDVNLGSESNYLCSRVSKESTERSQFSDSEHSEGFGASISTIGSLGSTVDGCSSSSDNVSATTLQTPLVICEDSTSQGRIKCNEILIDPSLHIKSAKDSQCDEVENSASSGTAVNGSSSPVIPSPAASDYGQIPDLDRFKNSSASCFDAIEGALPTQIVAASEECSQSLEPEQSVDSSSPSKCCGGKGFVSEQAHNLHIPRAEYVGEASPPASAAHCGQEHSEKSTSCHPFNGTALRLGTSERTEARVSSHEIEHELSESSSSPSIRESGETSPTASMTAGTAKERSQTTGTRPTWQYNSARSRSFSELSTRQRTSFNEHNEHSSTSRRTEGGETLPTACTDISTFKDRPQTSGTKPTWQYNSPRSRSFRETSTRSFTPESEPSEHFSSSKENGVASTEACCTAASIKERDPTSGLKPTWRYQSSRSKSFGDICTRVITPTSSPAAASKYPHRSTHQQPWQFSSPSNRIGGDASPSHHPLTPLSGKRGSSAAHSHSPNAAGSFATLTPTTACSGGGSKIGTPDGSARTAVRKIVEFESPSLQWSDWPVLGAAIAGDQVPGSSHNEESLSSVPSRPPREQEAELSSESRPERGASLMETPAPKVRPAEGTTDRNPLAGLNVADVHGSNKEKVSSLFSLARKAVSRLTSSPVLAEPSGQENEGTPTSRRNSRRMSKTPSNTEFLALDLKVPAPFSEERICALEAAGPACLQLKTGPVQNSPPDKIVPEPNPWSPVRKNGQQLGPFDCTKLN